MLSKFTFTADYFKIDIEDAIVSTPRQHALDSCYGGEASLDNVFRKRPSVSSGRFFYRPSFAG